MPFRPIPRPSRLPLALSILNSVLIILLSLGFAWLTYALGLWRF